MARELGVQAVIVKKDAKAVDIFSTKLLSLVTDHCKDIWTSVLLICQHENFSFVPDFPQRIIIERQYHNSIQTSP